MKILVLLQTFIFSIIVVYRIFILIKLIHYIIFNYKSIIEKLCRKITGY
jgi:hypothetical protein